MSIAPTRFLTVTFEILVVVYHLLNAVRGNSWTPREQWRKSSLELRSSSGEATARIPYLTSHLERSEGQFHNTYFDYSSRKIAEVGYVLRYLIGQTPVFIVQSKSGGHSELYERSEIRFQYRDALELVRKNGALTKAYLDDLQLHGVYPVFLTIPTKTSIVRDLLPEKLPPINVWSLDGKPRNDGIANEVPYELYRAWIETISPYAIDLFNTFRGSKANNPNELLYLHDDSHLASPGIALAASKILAQLTRMGVSSGPPDVYLDKTLYIHHFSAYYFQLPTWFLVRRSELLPIEPLIRASASSSRTGGRLIVVGTSFSERWKNSPYSLGALLATWLGRELIDVSKAGNSFASGLRQLKKAGFRFKKGDVVVWEVPMLYVGEDLKSGLPRLTGNDTTVN